MQKCALARVIFPKKCLTLQPEHTRAMTKKEKYNLKGPGNRQENTLKV